MKTKASDEWEKIFRDSDLVYSRLNHYEDVAKDEQAWANDYLQEITWGNGVTNAIPRPPLHLSGFEQRKTVSLGSIGQDTDAVLIELGYSQAEIDAMKQDHSIK